MLQIFDGYSPESGTLLHLESSSSGETLASSFQARLRLTKAADDDVSSVKIVYQTSGMLSGYTASTVD